MFFCGGVFFYYSEGTFTADPSGTVGGGSGEIMGVFATGVGRIKTGVL